MSDGFWQAPVDFFSLILILVAGIELGLIGFFGFSVLTWLFGQLALCRLRRHRRVGRLANLSAAVFG